MRLIHAAGISQYVSFTDRLYPNQDPTMDQTSAKILKRVCPTKDSSNATLMDIRSPNKFDYEYHVDLMNRQGLLTSDRGLYSNR